MRNVSDESLLQSLIDTDCQWLINNDQGWLFAEIDDWTFVIVGDEVRCTKGLKICKIIAEIHYRGVNKVDPVLKELLATLKKKVHDKIYQNTDNFSEVLERQEKMLKAEVCNSLNGWK